MRSKQQCRGKKKKPVAMRRKHRNMKKNIYKIEIVDTLFKRDGLALPQVVPFPLGFFEGEHIQWNRFWELRRTWFYKAATTLGRWGLIWLTDSDAAAHGHFHGITQASQLLASRRQFHRNTVRAINMIVFYNNSEPYLQFHMYCWIKYLKLGWTYSRSHHGCGNRLGWRLWPSARGNQTVVRFTMLKNTFIFLCMIL